MPQLSLIAEFSIVKLSPLACYKDFLPNTLQVVHFSKLLNSRRALRREIQQRWQKNFVSPSGIAPLMFRACHLIGHGRSLTTLPCGSCRDNSATSRITFIAPQNLIAMLQKQFGFCAILMFAIVGRTLMTSQHNSGKSITETFDLRKLRDRLSDCISDNPGRSFNERPTRAKQFTNRHPWGGSNNEWDYRLQRREAA